MDEASTQQDSQPTETSKPERQPVGGRTLRYPQQADVVYSLLSVFQMYAPTGKEQAWVSEYVNNLLTQNGTIATIEALANDLRLGISFRAWPWDQDQANQD